MNDVRVSELGNRENSIFYRLAPLVGSRPAVKWDKADYDRDLTSDR
jgi:hypothetical protein